MPLLLLPWLTVIGEAPRNVQISNTQTQTHTRYMIHGDACEAGCPKVVVSLANGLEMWLLPVRFFCVCNLNFAPSFPLKKSRGD